MTSTATAVGMDDRKATLVAAGLVAAVVVVLGFGSGIGSVLSRDAGSASSSGRNLGTDVQGGDVQLGTAAGGGGLLHGAERISSMTDQTDQGVVDTMPASATATSSAGGATPAGMAATPGATAATTSSSAGACASTGTAGALAPFWVHLAKAHLETSPGQQVADILNIDQYVTTHTVLLENMLAPLLGLDGTSSGVLSPFWVHLAKAHLETSPGQQVEQALDVDQYVKTHTVLVESMLEPVLGSPTTGCGG